MQRHYIVVAELEKCEFFYFEMLYLKDFYNIKMEVTVVSGLDARGTN